MKDTDGLVGRETYTIDSAVVQQCWCRCWIDIDTWREYQHSAPSVTIRLGYLTFPHQREYFHRLLIWLFRFVKDFFFSSFPLSLGIVMAVKEKPLLSNNIENRQKQRIKKGKLFCISNQETDVCVSRIWLKNSLTYKEMENTSSRCASRNRTGGVLPGTGYQIFVFLSTCVWLCEQTNRKW